jgi:tetratricopeptide (TPR) repeat protein
MWMNPAWKQAQAPWRFLLSVYSHQSEMSTAKICMGKISGYLLLLAIILSFPVSAQDRPSATPPLLPFQTNASETTDEQLAMQFFQSKDYAKAAEIYERLYNNKPTSNTYFYYYYSLIEIKDYGKAEKLIKTARKNDQDALKYMVDLGYLYFREGEEEKAKKQYDEALKKLPANQQQVYDLANAFLVRNENEYAIKVYQRGRQLLNNSYTFSFELASIYERMGDFMSMLQEFFILLEKDKNYLQAIEDRLQTSLSMDVDGSRNEMFRKYVLEKVQKEPENTWYSELLWWYSIQEKDFGMALIQAKSLDRRMKEDGNRVYQLAQLCTSNEDYTSAIDAYKYLISKGSTFPYYYNSRSELLKTRFLQAVSEHDPARKDMLELEKEFDTEIQSIGDNANAAPLIKDLAHLDAFYLGKTDEAIDLLTKLTGISSMNPKTQAECKLELADILLFTGDVWSATLLYQQVNKDFKNEPIGELAKFKNAKLSFYIGEFKWAQAQLDILKASTSHLIANDAMALSLLIKENFDPDSSTVALGFYARADLLEFRNEDEAAVKTLDSITAAFSYHTIFDEMLLKKAQIRIKQGLYAEADTLLGELVAKYPEDMMADEALIMRARLNDTTLKNQVLAMTYYEDLLTKYPGSIYSIEARKRFRTLRGDKGF